MSIILLNVTLLKQQVEAKMTELKKQYDEKLAQKEDLRKRAEHTEMMLDRASKLVSGLAGERARWEETVKVSILFDGCYAYIDPKQYRLLYHYLFC